MCSFFVYKSNVLALCLGFCILFLATLIGRKQNGGGEKELKMAALGASKVKCPLGRTLGI